ncbi:50S ribosomal protein L9 [Candidatus Venteria ishoeyi]|nr:50S ribosomal protein L9 [Candidatus Venteria ishoeyi]MDM8547788.1 50S ribosomal protein L9 [Candidatus Venteria ishoeyi]
MELILLEKVKNLGNLGDKVSVKPGYGRNFLVPHGKAVPANKENLEAFEARRAELERNQADKLASATARAEQIHDNILVISRHAGSEGKLFGSVSPADIADAATQVGIRLEKHEVRMPTGPLRNVGEYEITLHLHADVESEISVHVVADE